MYLSFSSLVPIYFFTLYFLYGYLQLPSMMLQELPPWLNLCMLLRLGGVLPGLSTGHEIDSFIRRTCRMGYLPRETPEAAVLVGDAEDGLLAAVASCSAHVLRPIFPPLIARRPGLRPRPH